MISVLCCGSVAVFGGCQRGASPFSSAQVDAATESSLTPTFIDSDFPDFYQTLMLNGLSSTEKTERWSRFYKQRWIRWTGELRFIKPNALLFRQLDGTSTYDVQVRVAHAPDKPVPILMAHRFYVYIGRLENYDDGFYRVYIDQGSVFDAGPEGVPGTLAEAPQMARRALPAPPQELPKN